MYKIRGQDQKETGPFTVEVIRQWIAAGRAAPDTPVQKVGEGDWKPLSVFPEFAKDLGLPPSRSAEGEEEATAETVMPAATHPLAAWSVVAGALGLLIVPALVGLVLGVLALKGIHRSAGRWKGLGLAITGLMLSGTMLLFALPLAGALILAPWGLSRQEALQEECVSRAQRTAMAFRSYATAHEGRLPKAESWSDELLHGQHIEGGSEALRCPAKPGQKTGFALNRHVAGKKLGDLPREAVLFFESDMGWNSHGGPEIVASPRHKQYLVVGLVDGTVERIPVWQFQQLRWVP